MRAAMNSWASVCEGGCLSGITSFQSRPFDAATNRYWMMAHTPASGPGPSSEAILYNPLTTELGIEDVELRRGSQGAFPDRL